MPWNAKTIYIGYKGIECPCITRKEGSPPPILFLHGYSFRGDTWAKTGAFTLLNNLDKPFAAPDMPYGRSTGCSKKTRNLDVNIETARNAVETCLNGESPIIVGASLGGKIALYYAFKYPVRGLLLLSPYIVGDKEVRKLARMLRGKPVIIGWGEKDFVPREDLEELAEATGGELHVYEKAGHAMYLDRPDLFKRDLEEIIEKAMVMGGG